MAFPFRGYFVLEQQTSYVRRNALLVAAMLLCGADASSAAGLLVRLLLQSQGPTRASAAVQGDRPTLWVRNKDRLGAALYYGVHDYRADPPDHVGAGGCGAGHAAACRA